MAKIKGSVDTLFGMLNSTTGVKQIRDIVSIEEWISSPYFCGDDGIRLYPYWKDVLVDFHNSGKNELILYGSLGAGKTTIACVTLLRKLYELSCFEPLPALFGLLRSTVIYFIYFSVSMIQADRTGFGKIGSLVDNTDYFIDNFPRDKNLSSSYKFEKLRIVYGSGLGHQIGLDLLGALLDEGDFFKVGSKGAGDYSIAREIYTSTLNRRKVRFSVDGVDKGMSILISSPAYESDFVEKRIEQGTRSGESFVVRVVGFQIARHKYQRDTFPVFPGMEDIEPCVIYGKTEIKDLLDLIDYPYTEEDMDKPLQFLLKMYGPLLDIQHVPNDFKQSFETDILKAMRDILGKSTKSVSGYISEESVIASYRPWMRHPFKRKVITLSTKNSVSIQDFFTGETFFDKSLPRFIHIDQSVTTDRTGIACSLVIASSLDLDDPVTATEWMLAIQPPSIGEIPIIRCAEFAVWLRDQGYNIVKVTMDSHQSRASLQYIESNGIDSQLLSVDRDDSAYVLLRKNTLFKNHSTYDYPIYTTEMRELDWNRKKRKVDHPPHSSKDVTDAVAGSTFQAVLDTPYYGIGVSSISLAQKPSILDLIEKDMFDV